MLFALGVAALCMAWLIPGHYFPWTGFQQDVAAAIGALLLALAAVVTTPGRRLRVPAVCLIALALAIVPLVQWVFGRVPFLADALLSALYVVAFALTVMAATALAQSSPRAFIATFFAGVIVAAIASVVIATGQWLQLGWLSFVEQMAPGDRLYANFTQPNHLADLLGLGLVAAWWLYETQRIGVTGLVALCLPMGLCMIGTRSRAGWAIMAMLAVWWALNRTKLGLRTTPRIAGVCAVALLVISQAWEAINAALGIQGATLLDARVQQVGGRGVHWRMLWDASLREPLFGWGWMQVSHAQNAMALAYARTGEWISFSHNVVLDLLVWNGLILGSCACGAIIWWIASRWRAIRDADGWAAMAAGGVILVHSMVEFPHAYAYFLLPLAVLVGIVEAKSRSTCPDGTGTSVSKWTYGITCTAMTGMLAWICVEYNAIEDAASRTRFSEAGYVTPGSSPQVPDVLLLDNQREFIWFRLTQARPGMSTEDLDRMRRVAERFMPPAVLLRYALALGLNGQEAESARQLRLICHLWPKKQCTEGRDSWKLAKAKYPALQLIAYPKSDP
jgi:hypothetical protein